MIPGMDFGTTNSGMAVYDDERVQVLPLDPSNNNPQVARTAIYLTNDQDVNIGREAVNRYFDDNVGRPVKMKKVWVGEVEVYGADMYYVTDVYAWTDILSPGRLFLSVKSGLRDPEYQGTVIGGYYYSLENLIAVYLSMTKMRAEKLLSRRLREVVLGRPVHFGTTPQADDLAQRRLLAAAFKAGYEKVYLQYEPVAAAYHYAAQTDRAQNVLVFDFGGGTLDITIMRLDGQGGREILATGGVPIAGDVFDKRLVRARLPRHFGEGSHHGPTDKRLPLPKWIFDVFSDWQTIIELQTPESRKVLDDIARTSDDPRGIKALISLVSNNYALKMFDTVETAKRNLSTDMATLIRFKGPDFNVTEMVTRNQFENIIRADIQAITNELEETIKAAGTEDKQIDAVVRTGGSAQIPAFRYMLMERFGRDKVLAIDTFSSVTSGLGIIAHGIFEGKIDARPYTPDNVEMLSPIAEPENVSPVNLTLLQRRMESQADESVASDAGDRLALIWLTGDNRLQVKAIDGRPISEVQKITLETNTSARLGLRAGLVSHLDEPVLMVSSRFRFFLTTPGHLLDLFSLKLKLADYFQLQENEQISAVSRWPAIKGRPKMLIVTTTGYARTYPLKGLVETIEGPIPLKFDQPLPGLPIHVLGAGPEDNLAVVLDNGRAARYQIESIPTIGLQVLNIRNGEGIVGVVIGHEKDELLLITAAGFGRRMFLSEIPVPEKANSRGRVIVSRKPVRSIVPFHFGRPTWITVKNRLIPVDGATIPSSEPESTRSYRLLKPGGEVLGTLEVPNA